MDSSIILEEVLHEDEDKGKQVRLVVSEFRGIVYLHIREYYLSYDEGYLPTKVGINIPTTIVSLQKLLNGLATIMSQSEYKHILEESLHADKEYS